MQVMIHEVLSKTADYLKKNGWVQGGNGQTMDFLNNKPACTMIAFSRVAHGMGIHDADAANVQHAAAEALADHLQLEYVPLVNGKWKKGMRLASLVVADWNDDPDRTRNEIIAGIEGAAAVAKAQETSIDVATHDRYASLLFDSLGWGGGVLDIVFGDIKSKIVDDLDKSFGELSVAAAGVSVASKSLANAVINYETGIVKTPSAQEIGVLLTGKRAGKSHVQKMAQLAQGYGAGDELFKQMMQKAMTAPFPALIGKAEFDKKYAQTCTV